MKKLKRIAALTLAAACAATVCAGAAFTDQSDIKVDSRVIDTLVEKNVIKGYENGSFRPNETVSRAEMAKMIYVLRTNGGTDAATYAEKMSTNFNDVNNHWASGYIKYCYAYGIVAGKSSTVFAPNAPVTTVEAAKMLLVYSGVDDHQIAAAYAAAHVELAVRAERQVSGRVLKISAHAAVRLAHAHDGAERAVALDLNGDRAVLDLELTAHDGGDGQRAAERCGRKPRGVMNFACALDNSGRRCGTDLDARVAGDRAKNFIAHIMLVSLSCGEIDAILSALYGREALIAIGFDFGKACLFQHADKLLRLVDALLVRFLRARPAVPILFKNIELISAQAVLDCRRQTQNTPSSSRT